MKKLFSENENKELTIKVFNEGEVKVPVNGVVRVIGSYEQVTSQLIKEPELFSSFMREQELLLLSQLDKTEKELEGLKHVNIDLINARDLEVLNKDIPQLVKFLENKDNPADVKKIAKEVRNNLLKLTFLDRSFKEISKKKQLLGSLEYLKSQFEELSKDKKQILKYFTI